VLDRLFHRGVVALGCGASTIRLCPPLVLTEEQAMYALDALETVLGELN
jgi:4-aminobutyrate aminotransferase